MVDALHFSRPTSYLDLLHAKQRPWHRTCESKQLGGERIGVRDEPDKCKVCGRVRLECDRLAVYGASPSPRVRRRIVWECGSSRVRLSCD